MEILNKHEHIESFHEKITEKNLVMFNDTNPDYANFIVNSTNPFINYKSNSIFNLVQIKKLDFINESFSYKRVIEYGKDFGVEKQRLSNYHIQSKSFIFPSIDFLCLNPGFTFGIYSDNKNRLTKELIKSLINKGGKNISLLTNDHIDYIFVDDKYIQYLHILPGIQSKIESKITFYAYGFCSGLNINIKSLLESGGIFTFTESILKNLGFPGLSEIFSLVKCNAGKWEIRVLPFLIDSFKVDMDKMRDTPKHTLMVDVYQVLKKSVEKIECSSIEDYLYKLKQRYFEKKRFFFIVSNICHNDYVKTPEKVINSIKNFL